MHTSGIGPLVVLFLSAALGVYCAYFAVRYRSAMLALVAVGALYSAYLVSPNVR